MGLLFEEGKSLPVFITKEGKSLPVFITKCGGGEVELVDQEAPGPAVHHHPLHQAVQDRPRQQVHWKQAHTLL